MTSDLANGARLLSHHVDGLELSCQVAQVPLLLRGDPDGLEPLLARLQDSARSTVPSAPAASPFTWGERAERVVVMPHATRRGARFRLDSDDWSFFVAAVGSVLPRFTVQLRADYLLDVGPVAAYDAVRTWCEGMVLPLVGGRPPEDTPTWRISRLDLAADVTGIRLGPYDLEHFTTRATQRRTYQQDDR